MRKIWVGKIMHLKCTMSLPRSTDLSPIVQGGLLIDYPKHLTREDMILKIINFTIFIELKISDFSRANLIDPLNNPDREFGY